ncbi:hypothetical protein [Caulobacter segnis]|uniref:hypothetical protein n=1 Tax=Caulobacter segnis TaxID=88688 RepID=UPI00286731DE|nr:hypothetical protein [Caulobacter segnis]MDR6626773.1 hypothetical protein [Caulobacter segnis]
MRLATAFRTATGLALIAGAVWAVHAMANDSAPPPKDFVQYGQAHSWRVAHGLTGSVSFSGPLGSDGREQGLVITCSGLKSGGVQARFYAPEPYSPQLRVRTDDAVFRMRSSPYDVGGPAFVEGHGDLPDGYLKSLATTKTIRVEYAGKARSFPGPGKALAEHFGRYCAQLARNASRDE